MALETVERFSYTTAQGTTSLLTVLTRYVPQSQKYHIVGNFCQEIFSPILPPALISEKFIREFLDIFTALEKLLSFQDYCNTRIAGLSAIFFLLQKNFLAIR